MSGVPLRHVLWLGFMPASKLLWNKFKNKWRREVCFKGTIMIWTRTWCRHGCRLPGHLCFSQPVPQSCACPGCFQLRISPPWLENHGQELVLPWWCIWGWRKELLFVRKTSSLEMLKTLVRKTKNGPSQTNTEKCSIINFLRCQQLSPSRVPWARLQGQGEVGWQCCHSLQTSCGDQAVSSVWCFLPHPLPPAAMRRTPPRQKHQKIESTEMFEEIQVPPSSLPVTTPCINICPQWSYSAGNSTETLFPGAGEQQLRSGQGSVSFWGTSNVLPAHRGVRLPSRFLHADVAFTQSSSFALFIIFQGRASCLNSSNSSQFKTE